MTQTSMTIDTETGNAAPAEVSSARVHEIFSKIAKKYELFNALSSFGLYRHWLNCVARAAQIRPTDDVLDVAGGTGDVAFTIAKKKHPSHIMLTDLVPEMLEVAQARYASHAFSVPFDFEVVDAQNIPYADNSYDVVTVAYGIRNMPDRARALAEILRVLKPGGQLVCLEFSRPGNALWRALYRFYLHYMIPFWGKLVTGDKEGFVYLSHSIQAFPAQKEFAAMLEAAGFNRVSWENHAGGIAAIHIGFKPVEERS